MADSSRASAVSSKTPARQPISKQTDDTSAVNSKSPARQPIPNQTDDTSANRAQHSVPPHSRVPCNSSEKSSGMLTGITGLQNFCRDLRKSEDACQSAENAPKMTIEVQESKPEYFLLIRCNKPGSVARISLVGRSVKNSEAQIFVSPKSGSGQNVLDN